MIDDSPSGHRGGLAVLEPPEREKAEEEAEAISPKSLAPKAVKSQPPPGARLKDPGKFFPHVAPDIDERPPQVEPVRERAAPQPVRAPQGEKREQGRHAIVTLTVVLAGAVVLGLGLVMAMLFAITNMTRQMYTDQVGELRVEKQTVPLQGANTVDVQIRMGIGSLTIAGGTNPLMDATFNYNISAWKPVVEYDVADATGDLLVQQPNPDSISTPPGTRYDWWLLFSRIPLNLRVAMGVGESTLNVGGLDLDSLVVESGVGRSTVDLTGWQPHDHDVDMQIRNDLGDVTIVLPIGTGVRVTANTEIGSMRADGVAVSGDTYTNSAYGKTPTTINIVVESGLGDVELISAK